MTARQTPTGEAVKQPLMRRTKLTVELSIPRPRAVSLDPADSALVIVDMQNDRLRKGGDRFLERGVSTVLAIEVLLRSFRQASAKIIHVRSVRRRESLEFTVFNRPPGLLKGSWDAEIVPQLQPLHGEPVVNKWSHDPFNHTRMERTLAELGLAPGHSQVVVTGVATQGCIDCTVTGFSVRDYLVYVPLDCTAAVSRDLERLGFAHFFGRGYEHNVTPTRAGLITFATRRHRRRPTRASQ